MCAAELAAWGVGPDVWYFDYIIMLIICAYMCICNVFISSICSLGGESLTVAQNTYVVLWAKERELNLVFGLALSLQVLVS